MGREASFKEEGHFNTFVSILLFFTLERLGKICHLNYVLNASIELYSSPGNWFDPALYNCCERIALLVYILRESVHSQKKKKTTH